MSNTATDFAPMEFHDALQTPAFALIASRLANGTTKVRRDANPKRQYAVTFAHLGKLSPINATHLHDLIACFGVLSAKLTCEAPCILGLTESGIVPSFAMHQACLQQGRSSTLFHTSRINTGGPSFHEPHSHAPQHYIPPELSTRLIDELWIVEDEITTGRTLLNLLRHFRTRQTIRCIRVFAILNASESTNLESIASLRQFEFEYECILRADASFWTAPISKTSVRQIPERPHLIVGEQMASALPQLLCGEIPQIQHLTLSPWQVDGINVCSRTEPLAGHFLYNAM